MGHASAAMTAILNLYASGEGRRVRRTRTKPAGVVRA